MPGLTCNACNKEFVDDSEQKIHYKSDWHRYNLKRKVAGVPGVTEALFLARQAAIADEKKKLDDTPMLYTCAQCGKGYRSSKAHAQHLKSRSHMIRALQGESVKDAANTIIKPFVRRVPVKPSPQKAVDVEESEESEDEWEEVDPMEVMTDGAAVYGPSSMMEDDTSDEDDEFEDVVDPTCCFMCDLEHETIESCMVHLHKKHGFFIPDIEYLKDARGLLTYMGIKVKRDYLCLYCNERCHPFSSLEAVRKHMDAKGHCRVRYGDGGEDEEAELEDFYDYSSSYMDEAGKQLIAVNAENETVVFGSGSELVVTRKTENGLSTKTFGSREYLRYYKQKPRPTPANEVAVAAALASRYKSMGLSTVQSREGMIRMKVMKQMNRSGVEAMRTRIGMKNNVIFNLPKNVPY
ncbi:Cytoplasmic 60S subunit biogenesis factor REI1 homolog 1-like protein [Drosera capensis]